MEHANDGLYTNYFSFFSFSTYSLQSIVIVQKIYFFYYGETSGLVTLNSKKFFY